MPSYLPSMIVQCKDTIKSLLLASGPQEPYQIWRECRVQLGAQDRVADLALLELLQEGEVTFCPDVDYLAVELPYE